MCTILLLRDVHPEWPLVIAANRDEFYARPTAGPQRLSDDPPIFGGKDLQAGGTWLGVTPQGTFAAVTNQRSAANMTVAPRSRGELVIEVLRRGDTTSALRWLQTQDPTQFNPFNLVFGDAHDVQIAYGRDTLSFAEVPSGISVLPNDRLNAPTFPKVDRAQILCSTLPLDPEGFLGGLEDVLFDTAEPEYFTPHDNDLPVEIQRRLHALHVSTPAYGTRSSTIIALRSGGIEHYLHAERLDDGTFTAYVPALGEYGHVL